MTTISSTSVIILVLFLVVLIYLRFGMKLISKRVSHFLGIFGIISLVIVSGTFVSAQLTSNPAPLNSITSLPPVTTGDPSQSNPPPLITSPSVAVAPPSGLANYVRDETSLLKLGKALFWDMQLGSDGVQSCASCHFHAGADNRSKNQVSPNLLALVKDITFSPSQGNPALPNGPNHQLTSADFPFFKLTDPNDRNSAVLYQTNDVASSQGVFSSTLMNTVPGQAVDNVTYTPDKDGFQINTINVRRVEPRNTPTVINAIFNKLQFWDGRAKEVFNGADTQGAANTAARIYIKTQGNVLSPVQVALNNSSLASLVTGPPQSIFEMSAAGRSLHDIGGKFLARKGKKSISLRPLDKQVVHPQDSVLGANSSWPNPGIGGTYDTLVQQAIKPEYWSNNTQILEVNFDGSTTVKPAIGNQVLADNQFTQKQYNFGFFSGLAMQQYLSTLVSDQTPFDKFQKGDTTALTAEQQNGLRVFVNTATNGGGNCNTCHTIPEFTRASVRRTAGVNSTDSGNPLINTSANGFIANYGVRPATDDPGAGDSTTSKFKSPTLRNIGLTGPYMHNGGMATLEQVVDFYNRGRGDAGAAPSTALGLANTKKADLVDFLKNGLTDPRVFYEKAPFDHPQLFIPNGHPGSETLVTWRGNTNGAPIATDVNPLMEIPAVGKNGVTIPQPNFLE